MQLKPDCVRDTLLYLEEQLTVNFQQSNFNSITLTQLTEGMLLRHTHYDAEDIWYTVYNLKQIHFIEGRFSDAGKHRMMFCDIEKYHLEWSSIFRFCKTRYYLGSSKDKSNTNWWYFDIWIKYDFFVNFTRISRQSRFYSKYCK